MALTQPCIGTGTVQFPANNKSGIESTLSKQAGKQAGGGGFSMGSCNGNPMTETHQFCQHLGTWNNRNTLFSRRRHLRIIIGHRRGDDHHITATDIAICMTNVNCRTLRCQSLSHHILTQVRARELITEIEQNLGNPPHSGTTDTDHVDMTN